MLVTWSWRGSSGIHSFLIQSAEIWDEWPAYVGIFINPCLVALSGFDPYPSPKKMQGRNPAKLPFWPSLDIHVFFSAIIDSIFGELCRNQTTSGNKKGPFLSGIKASGKHCDFEHVYSCWLPLPILGYWSWNPCPWHSTILRLAEIGCAHIFSDEITIKVDIFDSPNSWWRNDLFWLLKSLKSTCLMVQSQYSSCSIQLWDS